MTSMHPVRKIVPISRRRAFDRHERRLKMLVHPDALLLLVCARFAASLVG